MAKTIARATVTLPCSLTGAEIAEAIEDIVKSHKDERYAPTFMKEQHYVDGDAVRVGQSNGYPYRHILISAPDTELDLIFTDQMYEQVVVKNYSWGGSVFMVGYSADDVIKAVLAFADELVEWLKIN